MTRDLLVAVLSVAMGTLSVILPGLRAAEAQAAPQAAAAPLEDPSEARANAVQPPAVVLDLTGIRPGMVVGELGAGRGRVTVHLATRVGATGKVYANDINESALASLQQRAARLGLTNVEIVVGTIDAARFPANTLDAVIMTWVYHHVDQPVPILRSLLPALKPWGLVHMVEPTPAHTEPGGRALTRAVVEGDARAAGFVLDTVLEGRLPQDNVFILRPAVADAPESHDRAAVRALWTDCLAWRKTAGPAAGLRGYGTSLDRAGVPVPEIRRRLLVIRSQLTGQPEGIEMISDPLYGLQVTGGGASRASRRQR